VFERKVIYEKSLVSWGVCGKQ